MTNFYIPRKLKNDKCIIDQNEAFPEIIPYKFIILLAEPGAGKTALLSNLAEKYNTKRYRANVFKNKSTIAEKILIIDGFDEVAKLEQQSAIDSILSKIESIKSDTTILSSRSSEWDAKRNTNLICEFLAINPEQIKTYYLSPLDLNEQEDFFNYYYPQKSFSDFYDQLTALDLNLLISNPQFLTLFISAYKQTSFLGNKVDIFKKAIEYLAQEHNEDMPKSNRCTSNNLIIFSEEIFAKILLSGLSGVSLAEQEEISGFHFLFHLSNVEPNQLRQILDTGLFKQADSSTLYEPIHRIVAEYCAANYIVKRIKNNQDGLSLSRCLSIIAPNNIVRTELKGLIGWMASLGNEAIQTELIKLDPYACIANGDPSLLFSPSKRNLIIALGKLEQENPFFRTSDWHRNYSVKGFITEDIVPDIKDLLFSNNTGFDLKSLLISLINDSGSANLFQSEFITLLMDSTQVPHIRSLVLKGLISLKENWQFIETFQYLYERHEKEDLKYASAIIEQLGIACIGRKAVLLLLKELANLYKTEKSQIRIIGERYFINRLIHSFNLTDTEYFLDSLTHNIKCRCNQQEEYECQCKKGISKIVGHLLDRYFELVECDYNIEKLALWLKDLRYTKTTETCNSLSVKKLLSNPTLKYNIYIQLIKLGYFNNFYHSDYHHIVHSGLILNIEDCLKLLIYAFDTNNIELWKMLFLSHNDYLYQNNKEQQIIYRKTLRTQAQQDDNLMRIFARDIHNQKIQQKKDKNNNWKIKIYKRRKRNKKRTLNDFEENNASLLENESRILNGQHWGGVSFFDRNYLWNRQEILQYKNINFIEETLSNDLAILEPILPSLDELALDSVNNKIPESIIILYAISYAIFHRTASLENVSKENLTLLATKPNIHFNEIKEQDQDLFNNEVERIVFQSEADKENFIQRYIEPQFVHFHNRTHSLNWLLSKENWQSLNIKYCLKWIKQYPEMNVDNLKEIFTFLLKKYNRQKLNSIIEEQISNYFNTSNEVYGPPTQNSVLIKQFWIEAAFIFTEDKDNKNWNYLKQDPETLFLFYRFLRNEPDYDKIWMQLSADKIYKILDHFITIFPPTETSNIWSNESTREEKAYSTLVELIKYIDKDITHSIKVFDKLLSDTRFESLHKDIRHLRYEANKNVILYNYSPPTINEITKFFDNNNIASVEDLRALLIEKLEDYQKELKGLETNPVDVFYSGNKRVDENTARNRIVDWLRPRLAPLDVTLNIETYMSKNNRCDFTATISLNGQAHLLVVEVKGQWHRNLYTAASEQLYERYAIHPNAEDQGIYLVLWFGLDEKVADRNRNINNAQELKESIQKDMPKELEGKIDIFVLDVTKKIR